MFACDGLLTDHVFYSELIGVLALCSVLIIFDFLILSYVTSDPYSD